VPVWPPADTPSRRDVPVAWALTNAIVGYATSVLVESVRPFRTSCNVQHKGVGHGRAGEATNPEAESWTRRAKTR
jgi:hypothetical protein